MNPFLKVEEFPNFPAMTPAAAEEALPKLLADAKAVVDKLEKSATPTWEGFVRPLEDATRTLWYAWGLVRHFMSVLNSDGWRKVQKRFQQDIVDFSLRVDQSRRFYELAKKTPADTPVRKRILDKMVQEAELSGVALDGERQKRFNEIVAELAKLQNDFRDHVLDATKAYSVMLTTPVEVEGLPAQLKAAMAEGGDAKNGPWKAKISEDIYYSFMRHSRNRPVREALMRARCTRASSGELDNTPIIDRILALRQEEAKLLGFKNFAELSLAEKCAPSTAAVHRMIDELASASKPVKVPRNLRVSMAPMSVEDTAPWGFVTIDQKKACSLATVTGADSEGFEKFDFKEGDEVRVHMESWRCRDNTPGHIGYHVTVLDLDIPGHLSMHIPLERDYGDYYISGNKSVAQAHLNCYRISQENNYLEFDMSVTLYRETGGDIRVFYAGPIY